MHFCLITKRQFTKQEQFPKVAHKTCGHTVMLSATRTSALKTQPTLRLPTTTAGTLGNSLTLPNKEISFVWQHSFESF